MPKWRYYLHSGGRDFSTYSGRDTSVSGVVSVKMNMLESLISPSSRCIFVWPVGIRDSFHG